MVADGIYRLANGIFYGVETSQPFLEINTAVFHQINVILRNAVLQHMFDHHVAVNMLYAPQSVWPMTMTSSTPSSMMGDKKAADQRFHKRVGDNASVRS